MFQGGTANEIADSIRARIDAGALVEGDALPTVRALADELGVNRNTVSAAYRSLSRAGVVVSRGRAGTVVAGPIRTEEEGFAAGTVLRDIGSGNPDPQLLPLPVLSEVDLRTPALYGDALIDTDLRAWATAWFATALDRPFELTVTSGAVDALERLLAAGLAHGDVVGMEDPCFLSSINVVKLGGYRAVGIPLDDEGMTVDGLRAALDAGARAIVCTPRAHNPTGVSLTAERAAGLRAVLETVPHVLVIEDDHYSLLSRRPYLSVIPAGHPRWALVRSMSKFLGPDLRLALLASDADTAGQLRARLSAGTTWVSRILQRVAVGMLDHPDTPAALGRAGAHYAARNDRLRALLRERGIDATGDDGLNVWVRCREDARDVSAAMMRRGWLVRTGGAFHLDADDGAPELRLTAHTLDDGELVVLADDLRAAIDDARR
ncbi:aminotransferase class I/II-fold pyridoxal phosphate-dependent enzyme [Microbacterium pseudoresistens]|uniref:DNA-binding transcriptional MocR family regulator n=1 Tax=Microbacterium pseudoresistens TaxID=640634 RepID=A0A7Y9ETF4_9MICO|nr:aminotransferase class I/II-fold pyridoxal phosphate-dependent enzyme [Microbacterium pseudoresistens]NYD53639.1 DNA-binding transcriptional MocR family regulator [Microbacterium pseudoresistens]